MYHPGLGTDRQLAQIRYAEFLDEAARERADRREQAARPKSSTRRLVVAFAVFAPIVLWIAWMLIVG